jgi:hypothetical protein
MVSKLSTSPPFIQLVGHVVFARKNTYNIDLMLTAHFNQSDMPSTSPEVRRGKAPLWEMPANLSRMRS